jgi:hypothetical protein
MIAEINQLPVGLRQPMDEELAWELLWNDPLRFVLKLWELSVDFGLSPEQTRKHSCGSICDSRCFIKCFPVCPVETLLRKQNLLPGKQKCFLPTSETFDVSLCFSLMFPSVCPLWETWRNIGRKQCFRNNVS